MGAVGELRVALTEQAKRSGALSKACNNDESMKLYLVLPMIAALGYDSTDPLEVYPNHEADLPAGVQGAVPYVADFAVLRDGQPVIAVGAARTTSDLAAKKAAIGGYFSAWPSVKLACITNGIKFDFFVDSIVTNAMDEEPFLTLDLETIAAGGVPDDVAETLHFATKGALDPEMMAERAHLQLVRKRLRTAFVEEAQSPTEQFCRLMMQRVGFPNVPREAIDRHYAPLIKSSFEEALVLPVVQRLNVAGASEGLASGLKLQVGQKVASSERELALFNDVRRRLAFLVSDETLFAAIDRIGYRDSVGKITFFLDRDPDGRMFEVIRGVGSVDKFVFPGQLGEFVTSDVRAVDAPLKAVFEALVWATQDEPGDIEPVRRAAG